MIIKTKNKIRKCYKTNPKRNGTHASQLVYNALTVNGAITLSR